MIESGKKVKQQSNYTRSRVAGYCCGRKCGKEDANVPYTDAEYEYFEQRQLPARPLGPGAAGPGPLHPLLAHTDKRPAAEEQVYAEPILVNNITNIHHVNTASPLGDPATQLNYRKRCLKVD